ncbi:hypothetical protein AO703_00285 [[Enterobacter] lignolyticus]|uniref:Uncharacterized protein n=1 Tax=[Enterobacter] lignolyticus TaxID=1334193 RepID=A0A806X172_9ENTR|nr:hypothetical protein AO703_00285 [[Enterobacter] lignolyticus]
MLMVLIAIFQIWKVMTKANILKALSLLLGILPLKQTLLSLVKKPAITTYGLQVRSICGFTRKIRKR